MESSQQIEQTILGQTDGYLQVIYLDETTSTNDRLKELAKAGELDKPTVLVTASQTAGRGTRDRQWFQAGGKDIAFSIAIPFAGDDLRDPRISLAIGAMLAKGLETVLRPHQPGLSIAQKWPNDILLGTPPLKCGGVLIETTRGWMVVGIGVNVNSLVSDYPGRIAVGITTIHEHLGKELDLSGLVCKLVVGISQNLGLAGSPARAQIDIDGWMQEWNARDATGGKHYMLRRGGESIPVAAVGVDFQSGGLLCEAADGSPFTVTSYTELEEIA